MRNEAASRAFRERQLEIIISGFAKNIAFCLNFSMNLSNSNSWHPLFTQRSKFFHFFCCYTHFSKSSPFQQQRPSWSLDHERFSRSVSPGVTDLQLNLFGWLLHNIPRPVDLLLFGQSRKENPQ